MDQKWWFNKWRSNLSFHSPREREKNTGSRGFVQRFCTVIFYEWLCYRDHNSCICVCFVLQSLEMEEEDQFAREKIGNFLFSFSCSHFKIQQDGRLQICWGTLQEETEWCPPFLDESQVSITKSAENRQEEKIGSEGRCSSDVKIRNWVPGLQSSNQRMRIISNSQWRGLKQRQR